MPRKKSGILTEAELHIMDVLWEKGSATVGDVVAALSHSRQWAYSTALTFLRIMEEKGCVRHTKKGRAYVYYPVLGRDAARTRALKDILHRFFHNSPGELVLNILEGEELGDEEMNQIREMIQDSERE